MTLPARPAPEVHAADRGDTYVLTDPTRAVGRAFELAGLLRLITDDDGRGQVTPGR